MRFLITGTAGFIGFHLARRLLAEGHDVVGVDGMTPYYDVSLKRARHEILSRSNHFVEYVEMLENMPALEKIAEKHPVDVIVHLAAQAGVRYSLENPRAYVDANLVGTFNVMEIARAQAPKHFLFASTSSVYGANKDMPFSERERADHPLTLYAATKKATEDMAHSYAHLWKIPTTAFRFFTVYGPWGRPDMALFKFVRAALAGEPIDVYATSPISTISWRASSVSSIVRRGRPRRSRSSTRSPRRRPIASSISGAARLLVWSSSSTRWRRSSTSP
jgi:UDP-glucuronate 4-epimerase